MVEDDLKIKERIKKLISLAQDAEKDELKGSPSSLSVGTLYPTIYSIWSPANVQILTIILNTLNNAIFVLTNGKLDFVKLKQANFSYDQSTYSDIQTKSTLNLAKFIHEQILFSGNPSDKLNDQKTKELINKLKSNSDLSRIPDGGISKELESKVGGNLKIILINEINKLT